MKLRYSILPTIALLLSACSSGPTLISFPGARADRPVNGRPWDVSDQACGYQLLDLVPIDTNETLREAYQRVRGRTVGLYIENVSVKQTWYYGLVGTVLCTSMTVHTIVPGGSSQ